MKRDMERIRTLLEQIEAKQDVYVFAGDLPDSDQDGWGHLKLMEDDRLIEFSSDVVNFEGEFHQRSRGPTPNRTIRMTSRGHDFLEGTRTPERWKKVKDKILQDGLPLVVGTVLEYVIARAGD